MEALDDPRDLSFVEHQHRVEETLSWNSYDYLLQSADKVKTLFYATPNFFTHFDFTGHARGYNKAEDPRKTIEMIACPEALLMRIHILGAYLGIFFKEQKTGNLENQ